jgi:hypothetical protein
LGIQGIYIFEYIIRGIPGLGHKIEKGDCLTKTQDYAKLKNDVYDLTPVRCCNMKS